MQSENNVSYWRITLTIISIFILIIKVVGCFNRMDESRTPKNNLQINSTYVDRDAIEKQRKSFNSAVAVNLIYKSYIMLENTSASELKQYKIKKINADSLIAFDLGSNLKINKGSYYLNNHSDRLRIALKGKDDVNIFIYDFSSIEKATLTEEFRYAKGGFSVDSVKLGNLITMNTIKYNLTHQYSKRNGFALCTRDDGRSLYFAFESENFTKRQLEKYALKFLTNNLKLIKQSR